MLKLSYDISKYSFGDLLRSCFKTENLEKIHMNLDNEYFVPTGTSGLGNDTNSHYHKMFYDKLNNGWPEFIQTYTDFIKEIVMGYMKVDKLVYQSMPSFRIQYPRGKAVTTWHYDSDENHKHPEWEINIQVALTEMKGDLCTWVETVPGLKDYKPMEMSPGEFYIFNGNKCTHGNRPNNTDKTRVSFDFRVVPHERYNDGFKNISATKKQKFLIGSYYDVIMKEEGK
jgi:hypothetical protein